MIIIRRVVGGSMMPTLKHGRIVVAIKKYRKLRTGDIVIMRHQGRDKIKRITGTQLDKIYIEGDNTPESTDSRHFGWIDKVLVRGKVIWPRNLPTTRKSQK